jgi:LacI family transcriptional regulator
MTTIREFAALAAVSTATVSRVVNGQSTVAPHLSRRVHSAIAELGYRPSRTARALRTQRSHVCHLIISDIRNPFFGEVARGIEDAAQDADLAVVLCNSDEQLAKEQMYVDLAVAERAAGVILSPASSHETSLARIREAEIPVVTIDRELDGGASDAVTIDNRAAAHEATRHLIEQGFERIACIGGPPALTTARHRVEGYRSALREAGLNGDSALVEEVSFKAEGGALAAERLLGRHPWPDAILVSNAPQCLGALGVLRGRGIAIPGDIGLACFDDEPWAALTSPAISTVAQPAYAIGREAAALLLRRIEGDDGPPRRMMLHAQLRVRASSLRSSG